MKIIVLMLCSFFCVQVALAQETSVDSVTVSKEKMFLIEKAKQDRIIAEQKLIKEAEKQVKTWENNLKEWKEVLELLTPASQDKE